MREGLWGEGRSRRGPKVSQTHDHTAGSELERRWERRARAGRARTAGWRREEGGDGTCPVRGRVARQLHARGRSENRELSWAWPGIVVVADRHRHRMQWHRRAVRTRSRSPARDRATRWGDPRLPCFSRFRSTASEDLVWPPAAPCYRAPCTVAHPPTRVRAPASASHHWHPCPACPRIASSDVLRAAWTGSQVPGPDPPGDTYLRALGLSLSSTPHIAPNRARPDFILRPFIRRPQGPRPITGTRRSTGPLLLRSSRM